MPNPCLNTSINLRCVLNFFLRRNVLSFASFAPIAFVPSSLGWFIARDELELNWGYLQDNWRLYRAMKSLRGAAPGGQSYRPAGRFNTLCSFTMFIEEIPAGTKPVASPSPSHPKDCTSFSRHKAGESPEQTKHCSVLVISTKAISILLSQKDRTSTVSVRKEVPL